MSGQLTRRELELVEATVDDQVDQATDRGSVSRALAFGLAADVEHAAAKVKALLRAGDVGGARQVMISVLLEATAALSAELAGVGVVRAPRSAWAIPCRRCGKRTPLAELAGVGAPPHAGPGTCTHCGAALWRIGPTSS